MIINYEIKSFDYFKYYSIFGVLIIDSSIGTSKGTNSFFLSLDPFHFILVLVFLQLVIFLFIPFEFAFISL
jgi:hypothetical protein